MDNHLKCDCVNVQVEDDASWMLAQQSSRGVSGVQALVRRHVMAPLVELLLSRGEASAELTLFVRSRDGRVVVESV